MHADDGGCMSVQHALSAESLSSEHQAQAQAQALLRHDQAEQSSRDMQSQLIAAQCLPFQQPSSSTDAYQLPSALPKPQSVVPQGRNEVTQPCHSQVPTQDQPSDRQVDGQQQSQVPTVASSSVLSGRDQYEMLRLQSSLIPRQSHSSLTAPSQVPTHPQLESLPDQAVTQPQFVQSMTHKSAFVASAVAYQTPQAVSASQSASQHDSLTVRQSSGHAVTESRHQQGQHSMYRQLNEGEMARGKDAFEAVEEQGPTIRAAQEQPYHRQKPVIKAGEVHPYSAQGQGFMFEQQRPYTVAAMHQQNLAEHSISRGADGSSVTESQTVASSSSHYEFSFRRNASSSTLPRQPGTSSSAYSFAE